MSRRHRTSSSARDLLHLVHGPRDSSPPSSAGTPRWRGPLFSPANSPPRELLVSETNNKTKSRGPSGQTLIPCACEYVNLCYIGMHASRAWRSTRWTSRWMNYHVHWSVLPCPAGRLSNTIFDDQNTKLMLHSHLFLPQVNMLHRSAARHTFVYNIVLLYSEKRERESPVYTLQYREDIIMDPHGV
jgi:hypothetical protein